MRKLYNLPPTDPRYLALTDEQIALEWEHYLLDHPELNKETYVDPGYEEWEKQAMEEDSRITFENTTPAPQPEPEDDSDIEWEEVEIDV